MRKIREILRLKFSCGHSHYLISQSLSISTSTVSECLRRAKQAQVTWPLPDDMNDEQLEMRVYPPSPKRMKIAEEIDYPGIHKELMRHKNVTLMLLWHEYKAQHPEGISYSQFCYLYRQWQKHLEVWMRQPHIAGEKLFVDYAGQTVPVVADLKTGEMKEAQIFVAILGASNLTYVEATWTQTLVDWISSHVRTFNFLQGVPTIVVPDNLKSGVHKAHLYEPDINPTYQDMAAHYGVAIIPTRSASPRDKAKVENAVLQTERLILAKLRDRTFFSLVELNQAIRPLQDALNQKPFQKLPGSRLSQFLEIEKSALKPLPTTPK